MQSDELELSLVLWEKKHHKESSKFLFLILVFAFVVYLKNKRSTMFMNFAKQTKYQTCFSHSENLGEKREKATMPKEPQVVCFFFLFFKTLVQYSVQALRFNIYFLCTRWWKIQRKSLKMQLGISIQMHWFGYSVLIIL